MIDVLSLLNELGSRSKWLILYTLYREAGLTGRKIAKKSGLSWAPIKRALDQLKEMQLIEGESGNNRNFFYLNQRHFLYPALKAFFKEMEQLPTYLFKEMANEIDVQRGVLLGLKVAPTYLVLIVQEESPELHQRLKDFLEKKGLEPLSYKLVPAAEFKRNPRLQELPGPILGILSVKD